MKYFNFFFFLLPLLFASCTGDTDTSVGQTEQDSLPQKKKFEMAQVSEMTSLMLMFHAYQEKVKQEILEGKDLSPFPLTQFEKIFQAEMTKNQAKDDFFLQHAEELIKELKTLSLLEDGESQKEQYNVVVNSCVACHQVKCTGPITKIEKLFIQ